MLDNNLKSENEHLVAKYTNPKAFINRVDISDDLEVNDSENRDYYGFYHPNGLTKKERIVESKYRKNDIRRVDKWLKMINKWEEVDSLWHRMYKNGRASEKLARRIFKGIPDRFRMTVWPLLLCVADVKNKNRDIYTKMLHQALSSSGSLNQIDLDVNRTFRNTVYFRDRYGPRQCALFRVLAAYSVYNSEVGYCQGMSELAGLFLIYIEDEEDAFWALNQLMTSYRYNMHSVYVADFPGLKRLFAHHERIVRKLLPILDKHFTKHDMLTSTYALKWYMQCFLDRLPVTLVLRLWDIYLLEGEKLLLAMAYNILKMHSKRLLRMDQMQMTSFFQDDLAKDFLFDDDDVIDSLKDCLELLHKNKLDTPPPLASDVLPKRLGQFSSDPIWRISNGTLTVRSQTATLKPPEETTPHIKPQLTDTSRFNGKLRARYSPSHLPNTIPVDPVSLGSSSLSSTFSKSSNYSPGFATSASILTAAAMKNSGRRYMPTAVSSQKYGNNPNYILISNQNMKLNHIRSSRFEIPYSPSSSIGGNTSNNDKTNNVPSTHLHSPSITPSQSVINSPDESYATTGGRHYRIPSRLSPSSNSSKVLRLYESGNDSNTRVSVESNSAAKISPQLRLSRYTQNKEISINRQSAEYSHGIIRKPDIPIISTTPITTSSSQLNRWTSEQILSVNVNRPSSTTSSEISLEQPWQKRERSPSKTEDKIIKKCDSISAINSPIDGIITKFNGKTVPLPTSTPTGVWNVLNNSNYLTHTSSNVPVNSSVYSPTSPDLSIESHDTKYSQTVFTSSSSLSPVTRRIRIIRLQDEENEKGNVGDYFSNVPVKKPYSESVQPINDYVRRIPSMPRSKLIMRPTEIIMPAPKPVPKTTNTKFITIQSAD